MIIEVKRDLLLVCDDFFCVDEKGDNVVRDIVWVGGCVGGHDRWEDFLCAFDASNNLEPVCNEGNIIHDVNLVLSVFVVVAHFVAEIPVFECVAVVASCFEEGIICALANLVLFRFSRVVVGAAVRNNCDGVEDSALPECDKIGVLVDFYCCGIGWDFFVVLGPVSYFIIRPGCARQINRVAIFDATSPDFGRVAIFAAVWIDRNVKVDILPISNKGGVFVDVY